MPHNSTAKAALVLYIAGAAGLVWDIVYPRRCKIGASITQSGCGNTAGAAVFRLPETADGKNRPQWPVCLVLVEAAGIEPASESPLQSVLHT